MGKIVKTLRFIGDIGENRITALLDSGAGLSLIRQDIWEKIGRHSLNLPSPIGFHMANGEEGLKADKIGTVIIEMKDKFLSGSFYIIDKLSREVIIGVDFMQTWEIKLDLKNEDYTVGIDPQHVEIA